MKNLEFGDDLNKAGQTSPACGCAGWGCSCVPQCHPLASTSAVVPNLQARLEQVGSVMPFSLCMLCRL